MEIRWTADSPCIWVDGIALPGTVGRADMDHGRMEVFLGWDEVCDINLDRMEKLYCGMSHAEDSNDDRALRLKKLCFEDVLYHCSLWHMFVLSL